MLPEDAPSSWRKVFLNCAALIETELNPIELLSSLQEIERKMGRQRAERWSPRTVDIDIISFGNLKIEQPNLTIPHPETLKRNFVLSPLCEICPGLNINGKTVLEHKRSLPSQLSSWMQIVNVTPDSFSGDGLLQSDNQESISSAVIPNYFDIGAESTRPGAKTLTTSEEWDRIEKVLLSFDTSSWFRPKISLDTRNALTAAKAMDLGIDVINDVSGLADPEMLEVAKSGNVDLIVMHNLGIPADPKETIPAEDNPVAAVTRFLSEKIEILDKKGINLERVLIDPGIGFGKTANQSWQLIQNIDQLNSIGVRIIVGHSRKSFLKEITAAPPEERDIHTIAISQQLEQKAVDVIRVHNLAAHYHFIDSIWRMNSL